MCAVTCLPSHHHLEPFFNLLWVRIYLLQPWLTNKNQVNYKLWEAWQGWVMARATCCHDIIINDPIWSHINSCNDNINTNKQLIYHLSLWIHFNLNFELLINTTILVVFAMDTGSVVYYYSVCLALICFVFVFVGQKRGGGTPCSAGITTRRM